MARNQGKNFFEAHWDWLVAIAGLVLIVVSYWLNYQMTDDKKAVRRGGAAESEEVAKVDLAGPEAALKQFGHPAQLAALDVKGSFLASHARTFCTPADGSAGCGAVLLPESDTCVNAACGKSQKEASERMVLDRDEDGMTDEYEVANGLNPEVDDRDDDLDGDGFTNFEEFEAKTKPNDPLDHPEYFESKRTIAKLLGMGSPVTTTLQFIGRSPYKIGGKYRLSFYDPELVRKYKGLGNYTMEAFEGDEIQLPRSSRTGKTLEPIKTGFILVKYTEKIEKVQRKGVAGSINEDRSFVTLKRKSDGTEFTFVLNGNYKKKPRQTILDAKAKIEFAGVRDVPVFEVGKGEKIDLIKYGVSYTVVKIAKDEVKPDHLIVTLKNDITGKIYVLATGDGT